MLSRHADKVYAALRMLAGLLFAFHGMQKLFGVLADPSRPLPEVGTQMWVGGLIEFVAGSMIFLGLATRLAAFVASGEMAVAYLQFHWKVFDLPFRWDFSGAFDRTFFPIVNQGELALLYCFLFLYFVFAGSGRCSIDRLLAKGRAVAAPAPAAIPPPSREAVPPPSRERTHTA